MSNFITYLGYIIKHQVTVLSRGVKVYTVQNGGITCEFKLVENARLYVKWIQARRKYGICSKEDFAAHYALEQAVCRTHVIL